jgi:zinc transport system substrate-binding protein
MRVDVVRWLSGMGVAAVLLLAACGGEPPSPDPEAPRFVTTIPPFEMILRPIVDGRGTVERLLAPGATPHTYDPTPSDLRATTGATALVYGAESLDGWAAGLSAPRRLVLLDLLPAGAQRAFESDGHHGTAGVDPHFWTDPLAVKQLLPVLADTLCALDAKGCSVYRANADSFATALTALDTRLRALLEPVRDQPVLLARPFFRYFLDRYGPRLLGIVELQPGTEPTPRQLKRLVDRAEATGARAVLTQEAFSERAARAVAESADIPLVPLDPLGGTAGRTTYADLLLDNARRLREALGPPR